MAKPDDVLVDRTSIGPISTGIDCTTCERGCYAPVFRGSGWFVGLVKQALYWVLLTVLPVVLVVSGNRPSIACLIRQMLFRLQHCRTGNQDPTIDLEPDAYGSHIARIKNAYAKSDDWAQWMLENRNRYETAFKKARLRPAAMVMAFRYQSDPLAYNPPWASEVEHMTALKTFADMSYPCYDFEFAFEGDPVSSYANVTVGYGIQTSYASGKDVYLHFETIFAHEFGHVMAIAHHYDLPDASDSPAHMPPGETLCIMARNAVQWCSACRTALCLPLDVDHTAAITTAMQDILSRYPY